MISNIRLSVVYAEFDIAMLSVIMLNVVMLNVIAPDLRILSRVFYHCATQGKRHVLEFYLLSKCSHISFCCRMF
jgi:hypothetical protein